MSTRLRAIRRLVTVAGLTSVLGVVTIPVSGAALAAELTITVAPGSTAGPVAAEIGDVVTINGENVTVTDLDVPEHGVLPEVLVSTVPNPAAIPCETSGLETETITFSYGSVLSPTDVPEQAVLDALASRSIASASIQILVAAPPPPPPPPPPPVDPPPPPPPPPVDPPVAQQPDPEPSDSPRPTTESVDREPAALPPELTGAATEPGTPVVASKSTEPESGVGGSTGGLSALGVPRGSGPGPAIQSSAQAAGLDDLPMALDVPSLLALMSICVVGAGVGRLQHRPVGQRR